MRRKGQQDHSERSSPSSSLKKRRGSGSSTKSRYDVVVVVVIHDYFASLYPNAITVTKGMRLELINGTPNDDWWLVKVGDKIGIVPAKYLRVDNGSNPETIDGYIDKNRREAERLLLSPHIQPGQYIIRPSREANNFALSLRCGNATNDIPVVKHYRITRDQRKFYIRTVGARFKERVRSFYSIHALIEYFQRKKCLSCRLTVPCPPSRPPHVLLHEVEVPRQGVELNEQIGSGNFGKVYRGMLHGALPVAVKQLNCRNAEAAKDDLHSEADKMRRLVHDKIVQLIGVCTRDWPLLMIIEFMPKGNLQKYLHKIRATRFANCPLGWKSPRERFDRQLDILIQVAAGMAYVESRKFIHRDLRAVNILVGEENEVKVGDFGLAKEDTDYYYGGDGTKFPVRWAAPEILTSRRFSIKSDVWSFGILAHEVITMGENPYSDLTNNETVMTRVRDGHKMSSPHNGATIFCTPSLYAGVMAACWRTDPHDRPSFETLHQYLEEYIVPDEESHYIAPTEVAFETNRPNRGPTQNFVRYDEAVAQF